jgi:dethiobiotin synthetase
LKLFITGTDTGIGKTWVTAVLAAKALEEGQSVIYYKPMQTGSPPEQVPEDPGFIQAALKGRVQTVCRYCFEPPVAPAVADTQNRIDLEVIRQDIQQYEEDADLLLVEGAGGLMVPITCSALVIDLIEMLRIPVLLVAHSRLGTINHTLLSIEALQARNIPIHAVVFNFYPEDPESADLAVKQLIPTLRNHLPANIPLWTCTESPDGVVESSYLKTEPQLVPQ